MRIRRKLPILVIFVLLLTWGIWQLATRNGQDSSQTDQRIVPRERAGSRFNANIGNPDQKESIDRKGERRSIASGNHDGFVWSIGKAVSELKSICETSEASRARLMDEKQVEGATAYCLDVMPPSRDEIKAIRVSIAEVQNRVESGDRQEMDEWITWMIDRYDPFGATGRKIIGIRIASEPGKGISGWVLPTDNPEATMKMLSSGSYTAPENMHFYVSSYNDTSERFNALLAYDKATDVSGAESIGKRTDRSGADQPATALESKSEGKEIPKLESEALPQ